MYICCIRTNELCHNFWIIPKFITFWFIVVILPKILSNKYLKCPMKHHSCSYDKFYFIITVMYPCQVCFAILWRCWVKCLYSHSLCLENECVILWKVGGRGPRSFYLPSMNNCTAAQFTFVILYGWNQIKSYSFMFSWFTSSCLNTYISKPHPRVITEFQPAKLKKTVET